MKKAQTFFCSLAVCGATGLSFSLVGAAPAKKPVRIATAPKTAKPAAKKTASVSVPNSRFLTYSQIKQWQRLRAQKKSVVAPGLQPYWEGHALKAPMRDLLAAPTPDFGALVQTGSGQWKKVEPKLFAQAIPRPVPPASPSSFGRPGQAVVPRWVRYPLEFQLAGIGLGTRAVDKDRFNRIDRYGLFAIHGNPTAVVRAVIPAAGATGGAAGAAPGGAAPGGAPAGAGGPGGPGGEAAAAGTPQTTNLTLLQTPPETAALFPQSQQGGLPDWALAVTVQLDNNHVEWLYKRDTYSMGFVVDRLGFVDAIIVAGYDSPIASTQLEDPIHTVQLGDDLRKVLFRYGYPDDIVPLAADPVGEVDNQTGAVVGAGGAAGGAAAGGAGGPAGAAPGAGAGAGAGGGAAAPAAGTNAAYRTYDLRYEQSYNVVFTIRNNRVVRIYIFGDPDFFTAQRRNLLRTRY